MVAEKSFALKLNNNCVCYGCKAKVKTAVKKVDGVHSRNFDANEGKLTVSGTVDPQALLAALRKDFKNAELLSENQFDTKSSLQIVAAKPLQGVLHDHHNPPDDQLHQLSHNTHQGKASDDDDYNDDNNNDDASLGTSTTEENKNGQSISHEHDRLELKNYNKPFICSGCKELGFGPRFRSESSSSSCEYELHKECKECFKSKREISHKFFQGYTFEFFDKLSKKVCDACGKDICGFGYHSEAKDKSLDLHPCCSKLQSKICIDGDDFELHDKVLSKCKWCDKKDLHGDKTRISGWSYISARNKCHFHVYCVSEMVHESWRQGLIDNIDSSMALEKMDPQILLAKRKKGKRNSDHQFSRHTMKMFLKAILGVLLGDPTMILASVLVELFT